MFQAHRQGNSTKFPQAPFTLAEFVLTRASSVGVAHTLKVHPISQREVSVLYLLASITRVVFAQTKPSPAGVTNPGEMCRVFQQGNSTRFLQGSHILVECALTELSLVGATTPTDNTKVDLKLPLFASRMPRSTCVESVAINRSPVGVQILQAKFQGHQPARIHR